MIHPETTDALVAGRRAHWDAMSRQWRQLGPPLRPSAADIDVMQRAVAAFAAERDARPLRAFLLGVTPEIADMRWPGGAQLLAADRSLEMVRSVWPGDRTDRRAVCAEWTVALAKAGPLDVVIGDACLATLTYPDEWERLAWAAFESLTDRGIVVLRSRITAEVHETPEQVFGDLAANRIGSFHAFKLRLAMALQPAPGRGVCVHDVWRCWEEAGLSAERLHAQTGWPIETIRTIELYRRQPARLTVPSVEQTRAAFADGFDLAACHVPDCELGARNPVLVFRRCK